MFIGNDYKLTQKYRLLNFYFIEKFGIPPGKELTLCIVKI